MDKEPGILLIDKPSGISSFGVVSRVRRLLTEKAGKKVKVGHTGTLDPFATGLLVLLTGKATKRADEFLKLDKSYEAVITLGSSSSTADPEGEISKISSKKPTTDKVQSVLNKFVGEISQVPPAYSAIKVDGQRAYKLARSGKEVTLAPRNVKIYGITNVKYAYPTLGFTVSVSSGTYIRSLAVDIGEALGTGAYLSALRRTKVGEYDVASAVTIENIDSNSVEIP